MCLERKCMDIFNYGQFVGKHVLFLARNSFFCSKIGTFTKCICLAKISILEIGSGSAAQVKVLGQDPAPRKSWQEVLNNDNLWRRLQESCPNNIQRGNFSAAPLKRIKVSIKDVNSSLKTIRVSSPNYALSIHLIYRPFQNHDTGPFKKLSVLPRKIRCGKVIAIRKTMMLQ